MESWENKIITDKINSLQQLPAGYLPDLSSKWEIIEAGLPEKKKRAVPLLIRWSVAAAILLFVMMAGIKMEQYKKVGTGLGTIAMTPLPVINLQVEKHVDLAFVNTQLSEKTELQKRIFTIPEPAKKRVVQNELLPSKSNEIKINLVDVQLDSVATIGRNEIAAMSLQSEPSKRVKRRTFQKDFNDGLIVMDTGYSRPANLQFSFKFQLHQSTGDDAQPSRRLQLKQVL